MSSVQDLYRQTILDRWRQPRFKGRLEQVSHYARQANPLCGDVIAWEVQVEDGRITEVAWQGEGCAISLAAADLLAEKLIGLSIDEIQSFNQEVMTDLLGGQLPPARVNCGTLALQCVQKALVEGAKNE